MIVKQWGTGSVAYRDDSPERDGNYFNHNQEVAVSVDYPVKFSKYGVHPASREAAMRRLIAASREAGGTDRWIRIAWGGPGSQEVVAIFTKQ